MNLNNSHIQRNGDDTIASSTPSNATESQGVDTERSYNLYEDEGSDNDEQRNSDLATLRALGGIDLEAVVSGRVQATQSANQSQTPPLSSEINAENSEFQQITTSQQPQNGSWGPVSGIGRTNSSQVVGNSTISRAAPSLIYYEPTNPVSEASLISTTNNGPSIGEATTASEIELAPNSSSRVKPEDFQERKDRLMKEMFAEMNPYIEQRERAFGREHGYCFFRPQFEQETEPTPAIVRRNRVWLSRQQNIFHRLWNNNGENTPRYQNLANLEEFGGTIAVRSANIGRLRRQHATLNGLNPPPLPDTQRLQTALHIRSINSRLTQGTERSISRRQGRSSIP